MTFPEASLDVPGRVLLVGLGVVPICEPIAMAGVMEYSSGQGTGIGWVGSYRKKFSVD